jgi:type III secretion protein U
MDKTEQATPKRLLKAREEGDSGASTYAAQSVAFLCAALLMPAAGRAVAAWGEAALRSSIARASERPVAVSVDAAALGTALLSLVAPVMVVAAVAGAATQLVQTGAFFAAKRLSPQLNRLNVFEGVKRLWSLDRAFAVVRALLGAALVAWIAFSLLRGHVGDLARVSGRFLDLPRLMGVLARGLLRDAALAGLALAVFDVVVVKRSWHKRLMMSKEEVKREHKESEGDPQMKSARERAHQDLVAAATVANVKSASVVIVNPTRIACALRYDDKEGDGTPVVVASGEGDLAAQIVAAARDYGVPIVRDVPLARALGELAVGDAIPEALYEAVAEILREIWEADEPG